MDAHYNLVVDASTGTTLLLPATLAMSFCKLLLISCVPGRALTRLDYTSTHALTAFLASFASSMKFL